jgi:hypothetical protein
VTVVDSSEGANEDANEGATRRQLLHRGLCLEHMTLGWNVVGVVVLAAAAVVARSVALAGAGLDPFVEIGASTVVVWQLRDTTGVREGRAMC